MAPCKIKDVSELSRNAFGLKELEAQVRRSPMEMVCDILAVVSEGPTKPTHILYKANMSWKVLTSYLSYLTRSGMVEKADEEGGKRSTYRLTIKGRAILGLYKGLRESLNGTISLSSAEELSHLVESATPVGPRASSSNW
jgi:predicted transcriptional regulator